MVLHRIYKVIARSGLCSRRSPEQYVLEGRVKVGGCVVTDLATKISLDDMILVDGQQIKVGETEDRRQKTEDRDLALL